jgi:hypothetical protein
VSGAGEKEVSVDGVRASVMEDGEVLEMGVVVEQQWECPYKWLKQKILCYVCSNT